METNLQDDTRTRKYYRARGVYSNLEDKHIPDGDYRNYIIILNILSKLKQWDDIRARVRRCNDDQI
jgi:hypothetical protein